MNSEPHATPDSSSPAEMGPPSPSSDLLFDVLVPDAVKDKENVAKVTGSSPPKRTLQEPTSGTKDQAISLPAKKIKDKPSKKKAKGPK
jgi:hypothetical protein